MDHIGRKTTLDCRKMVGRRINFAAKLIPTRGEANPAWLAGTFLYPTLEERKKMRRQKATVIALAAASILGAQRNARAALSFYVDPNSWPSGWYDAAVANMQTVVNEYNAYGDF